MVFEVNLVGVLGVVTAGEDSSVMVLNAGRIYMQLHAAESSGNIIHPTFIFGSCLDVVSLRPIRLGIYESPAFEMV